MVYRVSGISYSSELYHHGIKGQKWGVRRYQEPNGTLTDAGRKRYATSIKKSIANVKSNPEAKAKLKKAAKIAAVTAGTALAAYGTYRLAKSGALGDAADFIRGRTKRISTDIKSGSDRVYKSLSDRAAKRKNRADKLKDAANVFKMDDKTILEKIARLENEKKLMDLTRDTILSSGDPKKQAMINAGKKVTETALAGVGLYTVKAVLTNKINPKDAADYIAPKPKKK